MSFGARSGGEGGLGPIAVVAGVVAAQHVRIERGPRGALVGVVGPRRESVAGGPDAQERLACFQMRADRVELVLRQCATPHAHAQEVGVPHCVHEAGKTVNVALALLDDRNAQPAPGQFLARELRQGHPGLVFVLADQEHDVRPAVLLESELITAEQRGAGDSRAPVLLDVLDHQLGAGAVRDPRALAGVVHRVGQVAHEQNVLALADHLTNRKRPAQHAHVQMNAHHEDVGDAALAHEIIGLRAVGDGVAIADFDGGNLLLPGRVSFALRGVVATAVRVVDGQRGFFCGIELAPALERDFRFRRGRGLGQFPAERAFVKLHRVTGAMDDEHAALAGVVHESIHARSHFGDAPGRAGAPMLVPHVAEDDGGAAGIECARGLDGGPVVGARARPRAGARGDGERLGGPRSVTPEKEYEGQRQVKTGA